MQGHTTLFANPECLVQFRELGAPGVQLHASRQYEDGGTAAAFDDGVRLFLKDLLGMLPEKIRRCGPVSGGGRLFCRLKST